MALGLQQDVMPMIDEAVNVLKRRVKVVAVFVFGSRVEGTPGPYSDIDLGVFADGAERWGIFERAELATYVQSKVSHRVDLHFFSAGALTHPQPGSFAEFVLDHGRRIELNDAR